MLMGEQTMCSSDCSPFQYTTSAHGAGSFHKGRSGIIAVYIRSILKVRVYSNNAAPTDIGGFCMCFGGGI